MVKIGTIMFIFADIGFCAVFFFVCIVYDLGGFVSREKLDFDLFPVVKVLLLLFP